MCEHNVKSIYIALLQLLHILHLKYTLYITKKKNRFIALHKHTHTHIHRTNRKHFSHNLNDIPFDIAVVRWLCVLLALLVNSIPDFQLQRNFVSNETGTMRANRWWNVVHKNERNKRIYVIAEWHVSYKGKRKCDAHCRALSSKAQMHNPYIHTGTDVRINTHTYTLTYTGSW